MNYEPDMKGEKVQLNFRIPEELAERLREVSDARSVPQSWVVREAIREKVVALEASETVSVIPMVAEEAVA